LWLTPRCLRIALRGVPLRDLLAEDGAELRSAASDMLPVDAFLYVPADYGERHLVRIAAKYGTEALFQERAAEVDDGLQS
ncbi:hypothetical protein, partial [Salmonella sp. SAL04284]|uniref:hypothetical protein n=1 Tax=Salmonella sp. SAL04284 TaxID=3159862 RepID=UPI00397A2FB3